MMEKMRNRKKKGFTLIELIVVIVILGILAAVLIPRFGGFTDKARSSQMLVNAKQVATAYDILISEGKTPTAADIVKVAGQDIVASELSGLSIDGTTNRGLFTYTKTLNGKVFTATRASNGEITVTWPS